MAGKLAGHQPTISRPNRDKGVNKIMVVQEFSRQVVISSILVRCLARLEFFDIHFRLSIFPIKRILTGMRNRRFFVIFSIILCTSALLLSLYSQQKPVSFLIINAQLADGTGAPLRKANVRVAVNHIVGIGELQPEKDEPTIDAHGLVLAPGFIDIHNHSTDELQNDPLAESQISQGITTLVVGADGESPWPLISWIRSIQQNPTSLNVGIFAGHATIRELVMGKDLSGRQP